MPVKQPCWNFFVFSDPGDYGDFKNALLYGDHVNWAAVEVLLPPVVRTKSPTGHKSPAYLDFLTELKASGLNDLVTEYFSHAYVTREGTSGAYVLSLVDEMASAKVVGIPDRMRSRANR